MHSIRLLIIIGVSAVFVVSAVTASSAGRHGADTASRRQVQHDHASSSSGVSAVAAHCRRSHQYPTPSSSSLVLKRSAAVSCMTCTRCDPGSSVPLLAFQHRSTHGHVTTRQRQFANTKRISYPAQLENTNNNNEESQSSFLSTSKATVQFKSNNRNNNNASNKNLANLTPIDSLLLNLTSDRTSLLLGSIGILILLLNRLLSFPEGEDAILYEASRSRIDLLGVFAAGSVLLNGITKLDVESAKAERVVLEGRNSFEGSGGGIVWNKNGDNKFEGGDVVGENFQSTVEWALGSFIKCTPARTAVLLASTATATSENKQHRWEPVAMAGILPLDTDRCTSIPDSIASTPILDRMLRYDGSIKGGSVAGSDVVGRRPKNKNVPKESYLPTLQALPGRVEFTYLSTNAQEALVLPVSTTETTNAVAGCSATYFAVVLGGDTAKSFTPKDIAWCREISSWIGDSCE
eukprot:scaffold845_cov199-Alexandrium_tamarense.AAC.11